ncbi:hypothetical protein [Mycolicibacterium sphagni]|nr:hypothetical protein [Mycolicibacterium sphagni]MCV7174830.1 hypothetical protein [Mycolicibacterium sphagni]
MAAALAGDQATVRQMLLLCDADERTAISNAIAAIGQTLGSLSVGPIDG